MADLFWLRAMDCSSVDEFLRLLRDGLEANPDPHHPTKVTEKRLGIAPARIYCYLGRTLETFGKFAFAIRADDLPDAEISPFDSGGLVGHIDPVSSWADGEKQAYLKAYTWPITSLADVLGDYPSADHFRDYLYIMRPSQKGPHEVWNARPQADIWALGDKWQSWTWEGRWWGRLSRSSLVAWTCAPSVLPDVLAFFNSDASTTYIDLIKDFVSGGVSTLIDDLRERALRA